MSKITLIGIGLIFLKTFILKMRFDTLNRNLFVNDMTDHFFIDIQST